MFEYAFVFGERQSNVFEEKRDFFRFKIIVDCAFNFFPIYHYDIDQQHVYWQFIKLLPLLFLIERFTM